MILLQNILHKGSPAHILIDGGRIARISPTPIDVPDAEKVDCSGKAVIPGFVNMHTHAAMIMLRGIHEDLILSADSKKKTLQLSVPEGILNLQ